jgi:hypoxanthine phosphoribosyltransferase
MVKKELIIDKEKIAARILELGAAITKDYDQERLLVVGILNGAFIFLADLVRAIRQQIEIDFVRVASYGSDTSPSALRYIKDIELDVEGKHVLIVDDIIDTGRTLARLKQSFTDRGALSVRFCVLIDKKERREIDIAVDYAGFVVQRGFLVGYGLDCGEQYRQLPAIYQMPE